MGRPRIEIDLGAVEQKAAEGLNDVELAAVLAISTDTLQRRKKDYAAFAAAYKKGRARADAEVSSQLFALVKEKNLGAIVWYEKTRKGYTDRLDIGTRDVDSAIDRELARLGLSGKGAIAATVTADSHANTDGAVASDSDA